MIGHNSFHRLSRKKKSKNKITVDGYKVDLQNTENISPPTSKKPRKSKQTNLISIKNSSDSSKSSETDYNSMLSVTQEEVISLFTERSKWKHLSEFGGMISDSSVND